MTAIEEVAAEEEKVATMPGTTAATLLVTYSADTRPTQRSAAPSSRRDAAATMKTAKAKHGSPPPPPLPTPVVNRLSIKLLVTRGKGSWAPCVDSDGGKEEGC